MKKLDDVDIPPLPAPCIGRVSAVTVGKGTVGLGPFSTPLQAVSQRIHMAQYIAEVDDRAQRRRAEAQRARSTTPHTPQQLAQERVRARVAYWTTKQQKLDAVHAARHEEFEQAQRERRRYRELEAQNAQRMRESKDALRKQWAATHEELRCNAEHERLERMEEDARQRREANVIREAVLGEKSSRASRLHEDALASHERTRMAVTSLEAQRQKAAAEVSQRTKERRCRLKADIEKEKNENAQFIKSLRRSHQRVLADNSVKRDEFVKEAHSAIAASPPNAQAISQQRERRLEDAKMRVKAEAEARAAGRHSPTASTSKWDAKASTGPSFLQQSSSPIGMSSAFLASSKSCGGII